MVSETGRENESVDRSIFIPGFFSSGQNFVKRGSRSAILVLPTLRLEELFDDDLKRFSHFFNPNVENIFCSGPMHP